ncbi:hypothetical protein [Tabrizicola thermarum]|uniref:hypothetical protein n=1 Tax=Tabrizicola thermarum TaxID=2670345 RepID=UPI000FFC42DB|nr:hypothetical protein [Tabrizicola thermarum]
MNITAQQAGWSKPPVKRRSRVRLDSLADIRREAARQYRRALEGEVKIEDMSRLINALSLIGRMVEGSDFERRLEALEGATT